MAAPDHLRRTAREPGPRIRPQGPAHQAWAGCRAQPARADDVGCARPVASWVGLDATPHGDTRPEPAGHACGRPGGRQGRAGGSCGATCRSGRRGLCTVPAGVISLPGRSGSPRSGGRPVVGPMDRRGHGSSHPADHGNSRRPGGGVRVPARQRAGTAPRQQPTVPLFPSLPLLSAWRLTSAVENALELADVIGRAPDVRTAFA